MRVEPPSDALGYRDDDSVAPEQGDDPLAHLRLVGAFLALEHDVSARLDVRLLHQLRQPCNEESEVPGIGPAEVAIDVGEETFPRTTLGLDREAEVGIVNARWRPPPAADRTAIHGTGADIAT